jgi:hypothetical protein
LSERERAEIRGLIDDLDVDGLWRPNPGPQRLALESDADEIYYGGAAGGGKTDLLLGAACTTQWKSIVFRREYEQLKDIVERSRSIYGQHASYNANEKIWRFRSGRTVEFGACQHVGDEQKFQGRAHDLKAFDELPHFTEAQYLFLSGWNRSARPGQRCRIIGAGNPPTTAEGEWVIRRWAPWIDPKHPNPAKPGELRWFARLDDVDTEVDGPGQVQHRGRLITPRSRTFIPAALIDNPHLVDTGYDAVLDQLPEPLRSQMRDGNFGVGRQDDPWQVIPTAWVEAAMARWTPDGGTRAMDAIGVDVARGGRDKTTLAMRHGTWFDRLVKIPGAETKTGHQVAQLVVTHRRDRAHVNVDVIGIGSAAYDLLVVMPGMIVTGVNVANRTDERDRSGTLGFVNVRALAYWRLREALDPDLGENIALPPDDELKSDLTAPRWSVQLGGIKVEAKEDIKKRIGRSPDCGDAVVLAAYTPQSTEIVFY